MLEDAERGANLVERRRALAAHLFGLPRGGNLAAQLPSERLPLVRRHVRPIEAGEGLGDRGVLPLQRAPHDLGRMRGEDEIDPQREDRGIQPVRPNRGGQSRECLFDRSHLGRRARIALMHAAPADAIVLLGDVGQVQELRERARDRQRGVHRHGGELLGQLGEGVSRFRPRAGAGALGARAHPLDTLIEGFPFLADERVAEQLAEQPDIISQRLRRLRDRRRLLENHDTGAGRSDSPMRN